MLGDKYVNTEFEMWSNLEPSGMVPLKDQRKSVRDYFPEEYANIPSQHRNVTTYTVGGLSLKIHCDIIHFLSM